jgi:hypothetical protein
MLQIPISAVPSQTLSVLLGGQLCRINLYQKSTGVFLDLLVNNAPMVTAALCLDRARVVRHKYLGFVGGLVMVDTKGKSDPDYSGFGSRYVLVYFDASELP